MLILLLRGWSNAGKDTAATILQEQDPLFVRFAFADRLKEMVAERYGGSLAALNTQEGKQAICPYAGVPWRQLLLRVGADERGRNPDVFAEATADSIAPLRLAVAAKVVITDWRYPNEYDVIRRRFPDADIRTVWVRRVDQDVSPVEHFNETLLINRTGDYELINPSSLAGLRLSVAALVNHLKHL